MTICTFISVGDYSKFFLFEPFVFSFQNNPNIFKVGLTILKVFLSCGTDSVLSCSCHWTMLKEVEWALMSSNPASSYPSQILDKYSLGSCLFEKQARCPIQGGLLVESSSFYKVQFASQYAASTHWFFFFPQNCHGASNTIRSALQFTRHTHVQSHLMLTTLLCRP